MGRGAARALTRVLAAVIAATGLAGVSAAATGCDHAMLARDGTLVIPEAGGSGASILTSNGIEYRDRTLPPLRIVSRDANDPWRAPVGFILPANGRFTSTSQPTVLATAGLAVILRPSDTRVPSWGGEVLIRVDVVAPAAAGSARDGENVVLILEGNGGDTLALVGAAMEQLGARDRLAVVDARGARLVVPSMPAQDRSLALAAIDRRLSTEVKVPGAPDLAAALRLAGTLIDDPTPTPGGAPVAAAAPAPAASASAIASADSDAGISDNDAAAPTAVTAAPTPAAPPKRSRRIVVLSAVGARGLADGVKPELDALNAKGVVVSAFATEVGVDMGRIEAIATPNIGTASADKALATRTAWIREALPAAGILAFKDVVLTFAAIPAPSHVLEASGGEVRWRLDEGQLALGDIHAGEARTDVLRVTVPAWTAGEPFAFSVTAHVDDVVAKQRRELRATVPCVYDDDIARIAKSRNGDVIAYASALATLRKLHAAFVGEGVEYAGGLRKLAAMHATSMAALARDMRDPSIAQQAEMLKALLSATSE